MKRFSVNDLIAIAAFIFAMGALFSPLYMPQGEAPGPAGYGPYDPHGEDYMERAWPRSQTMIRMSRTSFFKYQDPREIHRPHTGTYKRIRKTA